MAMEGGEVSLEHWARALLAEGAREFLQNAIAVFGLSLFIILYASAFLGENLLSSVLVIFLFLTVIGLTIFAMGLRTGLMPLGELVGARLPKKVSQPVVFTSIFLLGILCTIAEPAIGALKQAGKNTSAQRAPLLWKILDNSFVLMIMVGVGVGFAAMFGCLRLVLDKTLKPFLFVTCAPTMLTTLLCVGIGGSLTSVTGLAWDCGAVTTGPVTVPIVLALGIGVAASSKATPAEEVPVSEEQRTRMRRSSMLATLDPLTSQDAVDEAGDLSGFGIVTFASLFPVLTVWTLAFAFGGKGVTAPPTPAPTSPPTLSPAPLSATSIEALSPFVFEKLLSLAFRRLSDDEDPLHTGGTDIDVVAAIHTTSQAVLPLVGFLLLLQFGFVRESLPNLKVMASGLCFCYVGMFIFTLGLDGALVPLGGGAGKALPNAIEKFGDFWGMIVILLFGFLSGVGATFAEPALAALGETVEKLTKGRFKKIKLVSAVAVGVGCGISLGMAKVYYQLPLWIILFVGYSACLALTTISEDAIACIAWDSAGVTTGPVTVPIVLASGLSLGEAVEAREGFGILSCASIGPIMAVLIAGLLQARKDARPPLDLPTTQLQELPRICAVSSEDSRRELASAAARAERVLSDSECRSGASVGS